MQISGKIQQLQNIIRSSLSPIIDRDYYLLEVPYYTNIGDTLIWQGELDFLRSLPFKCKGMFSLETFNFPKISEEDIILFQGGGNFGDLWSKHHDFKMNVISHYPNNKFIFFPQTVFFKNQSNLIANAKFLSNYSNVTICARDKCSYDILRTHFSNTIILVPDMAFYINLKKSSCNAPKKDLLLKRLDLEFKDSVYLQNLIKREDIDITDWPTMMPQKDLLTKVMLRLKYSHKIPKHFTDFFVYQIYRRHLINSGLKTILTHKTIYTTRLHTAILSVLLEKQVIFLDNSYGKNKTFYDSWLSDLENIQFIE